MNPNAFTNSNEPLAFLMRGSRAAMPYTRGAVCLVCVKELLIRDTRTQPSPLQSTLVEEST